MHRQLLHIGRSMADEGAPRWRPFVYGIALLMAVGSAPAAAQRSKEDCPESKEYKEALADFDDADYVAAADVLERAVDCDGLALADYWLGRSYYEMGEPKKAIPLLESAASIPEVAVDASIWLAAARFDRVGEVNIFRKPGLAKSARDLLIEVVSSHPEAARAHFMLASYYLNAPGMMGGGHDKAMAQAENLATLDPALYERFLAREARDRKAFDEAAEHYSRSLEISADANSFAEAIGYLIEREEGDTALTVADTARTVHPNMPCFDLLYAGAALAAVDKLEEGRDAVERFNAGDRKICWRSPSAIQGYFVAASLHEELGESEGASAAYTSVLGLDPKNRTAQKALERLNR